MGRRKGLASQGVVSAEENAASQRAPAREPVHPRHGVGVRLVRLRRELGEALERREGHGLDLHPRTGDGGQLQLHPRHEAGEAKAADGGPEELSVGRRSAHHPGAVAAHELQCPDVSPKRPGAVVVFPVDVVGHCPAHRDEARAWDDRRKPAPGKGQLRNLSQGAARLAAHGATLGIEGQKASETARQKDRPVRVEAHVAVATAHAVGQKWLVGDGERVARPGQGHGALDDGRVTAPRRGPGSIPGSHAAQGLTTAPSLEARTGRAFGRQQG